MANSDYSYSILRFDPTAATVQYFSGADWYNCTLQATVGDGTITPAKISTSTSANFLFPNNIDVQGGGNGATTGGKVFIRGSSGNHDFSISNLNGNLYFRDETSNQFLANFNSGGGAFTMGAYEINANNLPVRNVSSVIVGTSTADASAAITVVSTTQGVLFPRMTTTQRDAIATPAEGLVIYNTSTHKLNVRVAAAWEEVTSA